MSSVVIIIEHDGRQGPKLMVQVSDNLLNIEAGCGEYEGSDVDGEVSNN